MAINKDKVKRFMELMSEIEDMKKNYPNEAMEGTWLFYNERYKGDAHGIPEEA